MDEKLSVEIDKVDKHLAYLVAQVKAGKLAGAKASNAKWERLLKFGPASMRATWRKPCGLCLEYLFGEPDTCEGCPLYFRGIECFNRSAWVEMERLNYEAYSQQNAAKWFTVAKRFYKWMCKKLDVTPIDKF